MLVTAGCHAQVCTRPKHLCSVCSCSVSPHWNLVQMQRSVSISVYTRIKALKGLAIGYKNVLTLSAVDEHGLTQMRRHSSGLCVDSIVLCKISGHSPSMMHPRLLPGVCRQCQCHQCRGSRQHGDCDDCIHYTAPASMHIAWALC